MAKKDKIFENKFHDKSYEPDSTLTFNINDELDLENDVHNSMMFDEVDAIVKASRFKVFTNLTKNKGAKLSKFDINELFELVMKNIKLQYRKSEIFNILTDYFDIFPAKFYNSLNNKYKDDLYDELLESTNKKSLHKIDNLH